jgi:hypothetical protein
MQNLKTACHALVKKQVQKVFFFFFDSMRLCKRPSELDQGFGRHIVIGGQEPKIPQILGYRSQKYSKTRPPKNQKLSLLVLQCSITGWRHNSCHAPSTHPDLQAILLRVFTFLWFDMIFICQSTSELSLSLRSWLRFEFQQLVVPHLSKIHIKQQLVEYNGSLASTYRLFRYCWFCGFIAGFRHGCWNSVQNNINFTCWFCTGPGHPSGLHPDCDTYLCPTMESYPDLTYTFGQKSAQIPPDQHIHQPQISKISPDQEIYVHFGGLSGVLCYAVGRRRPVTRLPKQVIAD